MDGRGQTEVLKCAPASVSNHRLAFNMRMFPPLEPSMASIEASPGDTCEGVLYSLTRAGYEELWKSEGGAMARPGYEEIVVDARVGEDTVQAVTLRAAPWMRMRRDAPPSKRYKNLILEGAKEVGLSSTYIDRLAALPAAAPSAALTALARAHGVIAVLLFRMKLAGLLLPFRSALYALLQPATDGGIRQRLAYAASEIAMGTLLLPTAVIGALIAQVLRLCKREHWIQFGPPAARTGGQKQKADEK